LEESEETAFEDNDIEYHEDVIVEDNAFDGTDEGGTEGDGVVEDGWTRIESNGFGGMLLGGRRPMGVQAGSSAVGRSRGFIDAAEAMIGTLLRTGEIHGDALAEIEGTLGIRIVPPNGRIPGAGLGNRTNNVFGDMMMGRHGSADANSPNGGSTEVFGTLPQVVQRNQPDFGYSTGGGGRWNEISSMEYVYGGPCITAGNRNYDLVSPIVEPDDEIPMLSPSAQGDGQAHLFPGGPTAATHARTQNSVHPLLGGVNLPPTNALVSDLQPHGIRARSGHLTVRGSGELTNSSSHGGFFLSNVNGVTMGTAVRSPRPQSSFDPVGWTDDGLPFDATVEQFSSAFENALEESMLSAMGQRAMSGHTDNDNSGNNDGDPGTWVSASK